MTDNHLLQSPYVGLRPFEQNDSAHFFGREREVYEVSSLIIAHPILLLYGQSGAGKTSLINAGVIPSLVSEGFEVMPPARVSGTPAAAKYQKNVYVSNAFRTWEQEPNDALAQLSLADFLKKRVGRGESRSLRIVIFDQFEELFVFYPERWKQRREFFQQVSDALSEDYLLRVVFAMREDYVAELDSFASILPEGLRTRFRIERLREKSALSAVIEPLRETERRFGEGVAECLVKSLLKLRVRDADEDTEEFGEYVDPVQLQLVCHSLWTALPPERTKITQDDLESFGSVNTALSNFYEEAVYRIVREFGVNEGELRNWFESKLITPLGTRGIVLRGPETTDGIINKAVDVLEDLRMIRAEWRGGARWYELTNDRLIEAVQQSNRQLLALQSRAH